MKEKKKVLVIGAGIGGLTTAIYLAQEGYHVQVYEKNNFAGGRCGNITRNGHRFDLGATLLMIPEIYDRAFKAMGKNMFEDMQLNRIDPVYKVVYPNDVELQFTADLESMKRQLDEIEPGSSRKLTRFMEKSLHNYRISMKAIIERNYYHLFDFFNLKNILILLKVKALSNHYKLASRYFRTDTLRSAFTFQNIYVGQNPFKASAVFAMLPFLEITEGVYFPTGGMYQVIATMLDKCRELNIPVHYNAAVSKIATEKNRVTGIHVKDTFIPADIIVSNADLPFVYKELLPVEAMPRRIKRLRYTCSAIVFHWGMDKSYPELMQHNVFVADNYRESIQAVFNGDVFHRDYSFYVHSPVKTDPTAAPDGQDSLSVIVPIANMKTSLDKNWQDIREHVREIVFRRLELEGLEDCRNHVKFENCFTQNAWQSIFNLTEGGTFGSLNHDIFQMGYMRPANQHRKFKNLFFVGGSTHPGNGVPMALISANLTTERILRTKIPKP